MLSLHFLAMINIKPLDIYPRGVYNRFEIRKERIMPRQVKILILVAVGAIITGGVLFFAQPEPVDHSTMAAQISSNALDLALEPKSYDFGTVSMKNGLVSKEFVVKNTRPESVFLAEVYTSCMCTDAKIRINSQEFGPFGMQGHGAMKMLNQSLQPGQEAQLQVTFDPSAHGPAGIGVIERTVSLKSDQGEVISVNIKANVTP